MLQSLPRRGSGGTPGRLCSGHRTWPGSARKTRSHGACSGGRVQSSAGSAPAAVTRNHGHEGGNGGGGCVPSGFCSGEVQCHLLSQPQRGCSCSGGCGQNPFSTPASARGCQLLSLAVAASFLSSLCDHVPFSSVCQVSWMGTSGGAGPLGERGQLCISRSVIHLDFLLNKCD